MKYVWVFTCAIGLLVAPLLAQESFGGGGITAPLQDFPCLTDAQRQAIQQKLQRNIELLQRQGKLPQYNSGAVTLLDWPVVGAPGQTDYGYHGISNFVDLNPAFPNQLLDYNCGNRTYDLTSGYNHRGIDMFTWPFGWSRMDNDEVIIVAAAPGTIIFKSDGNNDRSCGFNGSDWNAVYIQHADGSIAWYGHMKKNSTTPKAVGEQVAVGEYLGVVGSSGNSTGPHLHLEIHDASGGLIEPYYGSCNNLNNTSWWLNQRPYYDSAINKLMTHSAPPVFPACPNPEIINEKNTFMPGDTIYVAAYYRDQLNGQVSTYRLRKPDGSVWRSWVHSSNVAHYAASYWYWWWILPGDEGIWTWEVVYEGQTYTHEFTVTSAIVAIEPDNAPAIETAALYQNYPNPFNPVTSINFRLAKSGVVRLVVYDNLGQSVRTLVNGFRPAGNHLVTWDGTDEAGKKVKSGVYYYRLSQGNFQQTKTMIFTK